MMIPVTRTPAFGTSLFTTPRVGVGVGANAPQRWSSSKGALHEPLPVQLPLPEAGIAEIARRPKCVLPLHIHSLGSRIAFKAVPKTG